MRTRVLALLAFSLLFSPACKKTPPEEVGPSSIPVSALEDKKEIPDAVKEIVANFEKVYFPFDSSDFDAESKAALDANSTILLQATDVKVEVQGHADERGTTDYNLALGQKRADSVQKYMVARGVDPGRIVTISYGEERPMDTRRSETAWARNRRAEFRVTWGQATVKGTTN